MTIPAPTKPQIINELPSELKAQLDAINLEDDLTDEQIAACRKEEGNIKSAYEAAWQMLRSEGALTLNLQLDQEAIRLGYATADELTDSDKASLFRRVRKAMTKRKHQDLRYREAFPMSRLLFSRQCYDTGKLTIVIIHRADCANLLGLSAL